VPGFAFVFLEWRVLLFAFFMARSAGILTVCQKTKAKPGTTAKMLA